MPTIGLFGTCGGSKWRDPFKLEYAEKGISYFDPNKIDWKEEDAKEEARHLAEDDIILFPITNETYGTGSLSEVGFSILNAIRLDKQRHFVVMIEHELLPELNDVIARKESLRSRALVIEHLKRQRLKNLYLVETLEKMLEISLVLFDIAEKQEGLSKYNPQNLGSSANSEK